MPGPLHGRQTAMDGNHTLIAYKFANSADRIAFANEASGNAANAGPPVADDVGKMAHQTDDDTFWVLTSESPVTWVKASTAGTVPDARIITAGAGLTGGGDLTADRTIDVVANGDGSINVNANDIQVGVLATNAQHGDRGGGSLHANAVAGAPGTAGFITGVDQQKLDNSGVLTSTAPADVTKAAAVVGVSTETARADHKHDITTAAAGTIAVGDAAAEGAATSLARSDHTHALTAPAAPVNVTKAAAAAGVATTVARSDHKHDVTTAAANTITVGAAAAEGAATSLARSDHTHALTAPAAPANVTKAAASAGVATTVARSDHKHDVTTGVPVSTGVANAEGVATTLARSDHIHATAAISGGVEQTIFNQITVDTSTTSTTFVTLMSQAITVAANSRVMVQFDVSYTASTNNTDTSFRVSLDGTPQRGTGGTSRNTVPASDSCTLTWVSGALTAGPHTVLMEWLVSSSTALINVVTQPGSHHASLVVQEIAA